MIHAGINLIRASDFPRGQVVREPHNPSTSLAGHILVPLFIAGGKSTGRIIRINSTKKDVNSPHPSYLPVFYDI